MRLSFCFAYAYVLYVLQFVAGAPLAQNHINSTSALSKRAPSGDDTTEILLLDAPAWHDPKDPNILVASVQAFVHGRKRKMGPLLAAISPLLKLIGLDINGKIMRVERRLSLFGAKPLPGEEVHVSVQGCGKVGRLGMTSDKNKGVVVKNVKLGSCANARMLPAQGIVARGIVKRDGGDVVTAPGATIYPSGRQGFGVISDIDDTIKHSYVLNKLKLAKATLIDDPDPVAGMPQLYSGLAKKLDAPQFIYVSGSPVQLYPQLHDFIGTTFAGARGPIFLRNVTLSSPASILNFARKDGIYEYKLAMIDRVKHMYPDKKWLVVGDSTEKDPETYGEALRKYGDFVSCAWIRRVDKAQNSDARFAKAFRGVPKSKYRIYTDDEIERVLPGIDVARGAC